MMFNGLIEGEYVNLEENKKIEMKWKFKDWGDKFADVTINFEEDEDEVSLRFACSRTVLKYNTLLFRFSVDFLEHS